jgi:hypothetical protein
MGLVSQTEPQHDPFRWWVSVDPSATKFDHMEWEVERG